MKKTNSMRVAVAMLALTLITSCFVGGTFAKYTTSASGKNSARVAKFGVTVNVGDDAFKTAYTTDDTVNCTFDYSVESANKTDKVVAPGTKGEFDLFSISGSPEVAVKIEASMTKVQSIKLNPLKRVTFTAEFSSWGFGGSFDIDVGFGTMKDVTMLNPEDIVGTDKKPTVEEPYYDEVTYYDENYYVYYPIEWTLKENGTAIEGVTGVKLTDIAKYINDNINEKQVEPNKLVTYTLAWEWPFDENSDAKRTRNAATDKCDTILGNIAAGDIGAYEIDVYDELQYHLTEAFDFTITVTQID